MQTREAFPAFQSHAELRSEHSSLMRAARSDEAGPALRETIEAFLPRARATGRFLEDAGERDAAQGILDYWTARLVTLVDPRKVLTSPPLLEPFDRTNARDLSRVPSPFMGLGAFQESDAERFYGREAEICTLTEAVLRNRITLVIGPSGSGKSSIIRAGLLPQLRAAERAGGTRYNILPVVIPGSDPIAALLAAVCPPGADAQRWVAEHRPKLEGSAGHLRTLVEALDPDAPAILVIDQMEEVVTLCDDVAVREHFAAVVHQLAQGDPVRHRVIASFRDDLKNEVLGLAAFKPLAGEPAVQYAPPAMSPRELHRVIERPAEMVGLKYEEGIVNDLVKEVVGEPSALPLLQFTLSRLWDARTDDRITWEGYRAVGSPREALRRTADHLYHQARADGNEATLERIFVELVQPTVGAEFVRRRVRRDVLARLGPPQQVDRVLEQCVAAGLVRFTPGIERSDDRYEVLHEALIRNWPKLMRWLERKRDGSRRELKLVSTAELWVQSGYDKGYLLSGTALDEARRYTEASPDLRALVQASDRARVRGRVVVALAVALAVCLLGLSAQFLENRKTKAARDRSNVLAESLKGQMLVIKQQRDSLADWAELQRLEDAEEIKANVQSVTETAPATQRIPAPEAARRAQNARFGIRFYALKADSARFRIASDSLSARGFAVVRQANSGGTWPGLALSNTIFYYNPEARERTAEVASVMARVAGASFAVKPGASDGRSRKDIIIVHWIPRR